MAALAATASVLVLVVACAGGDEKETTPTSAPATPTEAAAAATPAPAAGLTILAAVPNAPTRVPRATPTPLPPGVPAPTEPVPPAPAVREIFFYVDTVTAGAGESKFNVDADRYCVISSTFRRGMHIVWRVIASDNTGTELQADDIEEAVLQLPHGEDVNFRFGKHGEVWFWTAAWDVPPDYPLGHVDFTVQFTTKDGRSGTYKQIPVSAPERSIESRLQIIG